MANHPEFIKAWWPFRMYSVRGGDLDQRDCELVILRIAILTKTWYEWAAHVDRGLVAGLSREEINRVATGPDDPNWDTRDALLLTAVDQLFTTRRIAPSTLVDLGEYFTERRILDLISLQGLYVNIACMIGTWGLEIEKELAERLPADVTEDSFRKLLAANGH